MKYRFICDQQKSHSVGKMVDLLNVSRSGYYAWQVNPERVPASAATTN